MRIGLLSDTHIPEVMPCLPELVTEALKGVDLILHAGDVFSPSVLDVLEKIAPVLCARGDDDYYRTGDRRMKDVHNLTLEGVSVGLVHVLPYPVTPPHPVPSWRQEESWKELETAVKSRLGQIPGVVVFGHMHQPVIKERNGLYIVNPGSATFPNYESKPGTVAVLEITSNSVKAEIIRLANKNPAL